MIKKVVAVVVTYNRKELLRECINAIVNQEYKGCEILVVDNHSTDGTYEFINDLIDDKFIHYQNTGSNLGGAGGFNFGIRAAVDMNPDYIWIMDDDTIPNYDSLSSLVEFANSLKCDFGFLSSEVLWTDGERCLMNEQKFIHSNKKLPNGVKLCRSATFVSLMFPVEVIRKKGLPIKEFFIWGDDIEYTRRLSKDYPCYYVGKSKVVHKTSNNVGSDISRDDYNRLERYRYAYRNEIYIAKKEGVFRWVYQICKIILHIIRVLLHSKDNKMNRIKIIVEASLEGIKFDPDYEFICGGNDD